MKEIYFFKKRIGQYILMKSKTLELNCSIKIRSIKHAENLYYCQYTSDIKYKKLK